MSVTLSSSIAVPIAKMLLRLTLTATTGNFVRLWCTAAPSGSRLRADLDKNNSQRTHVLDADSGRATEYSFEVAGAYQFAAQEITKGAAPYGGGYQNAPNAAPAETLIGETAIPFFVASGLRAQMGVGADVADLVLYVSDTLIQPTTLAVHAVASPAIQKPKTPKATTAANDAGVLLAVSGLSGTAATTTLGTLADVATNFIDNFNAHAVSGVFHTLSDNANVIPHDFRNPTTADALKRTLGAMLKSLSNHIRNDDPTASPSGTGTGLWHQGPGSGPGIVDWASLPLFDSSATISTHVRALADCWRSYELHRPNDVVHLAPDTTNTLTALPALLAAHELFLAVLAQLGPNAPLTDNSAKTLLVHGAGFEEL